MVSIVNFLQAKDLRNKPKPYLLTKSEFTTKYLCF